MCFAAEMGKLTATHFVNNQILKGADNQSEDQCYWPISGTTEFSELRSDCWQRSQREPQISNLVSLS
jgi:hypothetical protein